MGTTEIFVDYRGEDEIYHLIVKEVEKTSVVTLEVGDISINNEIFIERKTAGDFINSMKSNRLFIQASNLADTPCGIIVVVGPVEEYISSISRKIQPRLMMLQYRRAKASLIQKFKIPVVEVKSPEKLAEFVFDQYSIYGKDKKVMVPFRKKKKKQNVSLVSLDMVTRIPNVGIKDGKRLLEKFRSLQGVANASFDDLKNIHRFGKKKAMVVYNSFRVVHNLGKK